MRYPRERRTPSLQGIPGAEMAPERTRGLGWTSHQVQAARRIAWQEDFPLRAADCSRFRTSGCCGEVCRRKVHDHRSLGCGHRHGKCTHTARCCRMRRPLEGQVRKTRELVRLSQGNTSSSSASTAFTRRTVQAGTGPLWLDFANPLRARRLSRYPEDSPASDSAEGGSHREATCTRPYTKTSVVPMESVDQPRRAALALCRAGGVWA